MQIMYDVGRLKGINLSTTTSKDEMKGNSIKNYA